MPGTDICETFNTFVKEYTGVTYNATFPVKSNAVWKMTLLPSKFNPVELTGGFTSGGTYGTERYNDTFETTDITYNLTAGAQLQYAEFIISDSQTPERFPPVHVPITQCNNDGIEITMRKWVEMWEDMFGVDPSNPEPNSDGDTEKNIHRVRWHKDQSDSIFFSALFGKRRWMITNLQATKFVENHLRTSGDDVVVQKFIEDPSSPYFSPYNYKAEDGDTYIYPVWGNPTGYADRERLGRLYNWAAATNSKGGTNNGKENVDNRSSTENEVTFPESADPEPNKQMRRQGICPAGWHLPSQKEWMELNHEIRTNTKLYSYLNSNIGGNYDEGIPSSSFAKFKGLATPMKDICEPLKKNSQGGLLFNGGFNMLLAGYGSEGIRNYRVEACIWSSSAYNNIDPAGANLDAVAGAYAMSTRYDTADLEQPHFGRSLLASVRCVEDYPIE
ncbi:MAG: FISUMP domain-containing protein [Dysgonomonas sp.]|nr:FISUMP domain-containing protein [Dysgonomonas sp.]